MPPMVRSQKLCVSVDPRAAILAYINDRLCESRCAILAVYNIGKLFWEWFKTEIVYAKTNNRKRLMQGMVVGLIWLVY